ncbi:MAG: Sir2 family NAD-dependent protein deacetylase [Bacteroidota bacterium]
MSENASFHAAAQAIRNARAMIISAGAGMGVDSGLPDFRGDKGFWKAYPMYERLNINFIDAANPVHFARDPEWGWGFYGHRLNLYRATVPHAGFHLLRDWSERYALPAFVYTSNVDGQFQKAGFSEAQICEIHGSIHHLQCLSPCREDIWENDESVEVDLETMRARDIPTCTICGETARPNILMFGDFSWLHARTSAQEHAFSRFLDQHAAGPLVVIEMGAGTAIPSIRRASEGLHQRMGATVVRINPRESYIPAPNIGLAMGALAALEGIEAALLEEA